MAVQGANFLIALAIIGVFLHQSFLPPNAQKPETIVLSHFQEKRYAGIKQMELTLTFQKTENQLQGQFSFPPSSDSSEAEKTRAQGRLIKENLQNLGFEILTSKFQPSTWSKIAFTQTEHSRFVEGGQWLLQQWQSSSIPFFASKREKTMSAIARLETMLSDSEASESVEFETPEADTSQTVEPSASEAETSQPVELETPEAETSQPIEPTTPESETPFTISTVKELLQEKKTTLMQMAINAGWDAKKSHNKMQLAEALAGVNPL